MGNVVPTAVQRTVPRRRARHREHLTEAEMDRLLKAARTNRYGLPRSHACAGDVDSWPAGL